MKMKFSARFMMITFEPGELFADLSVRMRGEPLVNGFDAALSSMEWIENHETFPVDDFVKKKIKNLIEAQNSIQAFKVSFMEK